jgi:diguanylate cyclase (GGDEF)-like protein
VNDSYGNGAGDLLLVKIAERIRKEIDEDHLLARMGGDEFMVVMRDTSPDKVRPIVARLIAAISGRRFEIEDSMLVSVGASIGFACLPEDAASTMELRLRADQALYAAKDAGKGVGLRYDTSLNQQSSLSRPEMIGVR